MKRVLLPLICLMGSGAVSLAHAEGCDGLQHAPSAQEKAFYAGNFKLLRDAMPKPPAGWQYSNDDKKMLDPAYNGVPDSICGGDSQIYYIGLRTVYERPMSQEDTDQLQQAMQAKPDPAKQKQLDGLMAQQQDLIQKSIAAAQKQDYKTMDALGKQGDALSKQIQAVQQDMNSGRQAKLDAIQWDRQAAVHVSINNNGGSATCYGSPKAIQVSGATAYQCGAPASYRGPGDVLDPAKGSIVVVFGQASVNQHDYSRKDSQGKEIKDSYVNIKYGTNSDNSLAVHNVVLDVSGDDLARAQSLYSQLDLKPL